METVFASLQSPFYLFPCRSSPTQASTSSHVFFPCKRDLDRNPSFSCKFRDTSFSVEPLRIQRYPFAAVVGDATAAPHDCAEEVQLEFSNQEVPGDECSEGSEERNDDTEDDEQKMIEVGDKLIQVFMVDKPTPSDWRKLIAFSKRWRDIRPKFFRRIQMRADAEDDLDMKHKLLRFQRKLKEVDEDVERHSELLEVIKGAPTEIKGIVARRRKDFTQEFFVHVYNVILSYQDDAEQQNALKELVNDALEALQAYDVTADSIDRLQAAEMKIQDIINSPSLEAAKRKIEDLASKNQFDSTMALVATKAWSAAKDTDMVKDEAKDIMYHLYKGALASVQNLVPKEVRILKYLLTIEDPELRLSTLKDAFTPGEEIDGDTVTMLYTDPKTLDALISSVLEAYNISQEGTLLREARDLLNPKIIPKLQELQTLVRDKFM